MVPRTERPIPTLRIAGLATEPGLPTESIREQVESMLCQFATCYSAELARTPTLQGKAAVTFLLKANGSVEKASTSGPAQLADCLDVSWQHDFPMSDRDGKVWFAITFAP